MNNFGTYTFSDGKFYQGFYKNDKKHGYGIYAWSDGKKYQGWWTDGKQDGYGIYHQPDGSRKYGVWEEGQKKKWLDDEEIREVQAKRQQVELDQRLSREEKERFSYEMPQAFEQRKLEARTKI